MSKDPSTLLPLSAVAFEILLSLSEADLHGYLIMQDVESRSGGAITLHPGTLYRALARLLEQDLIVEVAGGQAGDDRRRSYRLTPFGRAVAQAEAARLEDQVRRARAHRLLGRAGR